MVLLSTKFQGNPMKTVGGVIQKWSVDRWTDVRQEDNVGYTIILCHYCVAGYKKENISECFLLKFLPSMQSLKSAI